MRGTIIFVWNHFVQEAFLDTPGAEIEISLLQKGREAIDLTLKHNSGNFEVYSEDEGLLFTFISPSEESAQINLLDKDGSILGRGKPRYINGCLSSIRIDI